MRVVLVGPEPKRRLLRKQFEQAGINVVLEGEIQPAPDRFPTNVDAIVIAGPEGPASIKVQASGGNRFNDDAGAVREELTPREQEVLALVAEGLSNKAIATALGIGDQTVKFHVAAIIAKLG